MILILFDHCLRYQKVYSVLIFGLFLLKSLIHLYVLKQEWIPVLNFWFVCTPFNHTSLLTLWHLYLIQPHIYLDLMVFLPYQTTHLSWPYGIYTPFNHTSVLTLWYLYPIQPHIYLDLCLYTIQPHFCLGRVVYLYFVKPHICLGAAIGLLSIDVKAFC